MILKLILGAFILRCVVLALPQLGIKTHHNLQVANNVSAPSGGWNLQGSNLQGGHNNWTFSNARDEFINRTRTGMDDGVCTKEVP